MGQLIEDFVFFLRCWNYSRHILFSFLYFLLILNFYAIIPKEKLSCYLIKHHAMKTYEGMAAYIAVPFLTSAVYGGERSASCSGHFTPREIAPHAHSIGGWVVPKVGLEAVEKRKISFPCWESNPSHSAHSLSLYWMSCPDSTVMV
jgi:hypothetical protein